MRGGVGGDTDGEFGAVGQELVQRWVDQPDRHRQPVHRGQDAGEVGEGHGVADAGNDVLALGVLQVVAVDTPGAGGRVAGEGDSRAGVGTEVAEDHDLDVHRGAQVVGDVFSAAVEAGALAVPGAEDRPDRAVQLRTGVLREVLARRVPDHLLVVLDEPGGVVGAHAPVEQFRGDAEDRAAVYLEQAAVRVPREALATGGLASPRTDASPRPMSRIVSIIPGIENLLPERTDSSRGLSRPPSSRPVRRSNSTSACATWAASSPASSPVARYSRQASVVTVKPGGYRQSQPGHLRQVGSLAAEQVRHVTAALRELVHVPGHLSDPPRLFRRAGRRRRGRARGAVRRARRSRGGCRAGSRAPGVPPRAGPPRPMRGSARRPRVLR